MGYKTFSTNIVLAMYFCFILDIEFIVTFFCLKFYWFNIKWHFISYSLISRKNGNTVQKIKFFYVSTQYVNDQTDSFILPYMPHDEDNIYRIQAGVRFSWAY